MRKEHSDRDISILFLNAGRRVQLIESFRAPLKERECDARVIATDVSPFAPGLQIADEACILPHSSDEKYVGELKRVCCKAHATLIIPLIDPDLPVLALNKFDIESTGARLLLSSRDVIDICRDKVRTHEFLARHGFKTPRILSFEQAKRQGPPWFIKPRFGSASIEAFPVRSVSELEFFANYVRDPIIQELITGTEITVDVFSDCEGNPLIAVPRERLLVRGGEVVTSRLKRNSAVEALALDVARSLGSVGPINIQVIATEEMISVIEINPRFGGGVPLSMQAGAPFARWTLDLALGCAPNLADIRIEDGLVMMRYHQATFGHFPETNGSKYHF